MPQREGFAKNLRYDIPAGLVVFLVALPLCLGIAIASDAPPISGLIAGIMGGLIVGGISSSSTSVSGPAAGLAVIVATAIGDLGAFDVFLVAVVLGGLIQIAFGAFKLGFIGMYFPSSVIKGMLAAIGLILILKQLPHFIGVDPDPFGDFSFFQKDGRNTFTEITYALAHPHWGAATVGIVSLLIMILWEQKFMKAMSFTRILPGALVAVLFGVGFNEFMRPAGGSLFIDSTHLVPIPNWQDSGDLMTLVTFPDFSALAKPLVWKVAGVIALIASLETLLSVEAVDKIDPHKRTTNKDRELLAQGFGNTFSGLIGGLPVTAVIVRSSANVASGARTKVSALFHGILLVIAVVAAPAIISLIPLSSLAAVLLVVGYKLSRPSLYREQLKIGWSQFIPFITTIVAILFTDLLVGIMIGLGVGFFFILKRNFHNPYFIKKEVQPENGHPRITLTLSQNVSFINKAALAEAFIEIPDGSHVIIDGSRNKHIDHDSQEIIDNFKAQTESRNIFLEMVGFGKKESTSIKEEEAKVPINA